MIRFIPFAILLFLMPERAHAMHISEGILPLPWAGLWSLAALPFVWYGGSRLKRKSGQTPQFKVFLSMLGAAVFILSCMPIPVPTAGTCSHPCGTGLAAILVGPTVSIFITSIVLLIQALFLAHGGLTTWGADILSMGIAGSFAGYLLFNGLRKIRVSMVYSAFFAGLIADWATYAATSMELALALHGGKAVWKVFSAILIAFIPTQLPLGLLEGAMTAGALYFLRSRRPDILDSLGVKA